MPPGARTSGHASSVPAAFDLLGRSTIGRTVPRSVARRKWTTHWRVARTRACRGARLRICIIGKFPPIQGGVSMRTYWSAHGLAALGHEVHVVTNAKEAESRRSACMMRRGGLAALRSRMYGAGSVTVHWTDPVDPSQSYIPMASPFVSKLAAIAARVHSERARSTSSFPLSGALRGRRLSRGADDRGPARGTDGRKRCRPPVAPSATSRLLYDHVLRSAEAVVAGGAVAERAFQRGVDPGGSPSAAGSRCGRTCLSRAVR